MKNISINFAELVDWWLYESVNKIVYEKDKSETDLNKLEYFVDYLIVNYLK